MRFRGVYGASSVLWAATCIAFGQGYPADEAPSRMTAMPGFSVELVAGEPMVVQPVCIEFDDRGRLWVIQYLQYPNPEGLKRVKVDRYSRTTYDRVPEPPPFGPRGADAITILEDTDGDGRADSAKNFVEGLNLCTGLAFGYGGVFVVNVPYLLFYPDADRDDVPDANPEVLLTGFGMEDAHSVANSLTWGPDGWLYGLQGSTVTANIRGIEFQQGIWRYHPVTKEFELFCEGGGNMWGLDFDRDGNLFASTNVGGFIGLHGVQGAYYWKQFGKHGALHNPFAYGFFEHMTHKDPQGGHVAVGGIVYEADAYPSEFRGSYIVANLLSHDLYWNELKAAGSTFETVNRGQFLNSHDASFAPSDMTLGPDGCLYVADWHDRRTAHPDPDAEWDRSNGRIYRLSHENAKRAPAFDLTSLATDQLVDLLEHPNKWHVRRALTLLAERRDKSAYSRLKRQMMDHDNAAPAVNSMFALHVSGGLDDAALTRLLQSPNPVQRKWAVRFIGDGRKPTSRQLEKLLVMAGGEPDVRVRAQLAASAKRLDPSAGLAIACRMAEQSADAGDPHVPLLLWWAFEAHAMRDEGQIAALVTGPAAEESKVLREIIIPRLVRRYAADGSERGDLKCAELLRANGPARVGKDLFVALDLGLQDRITGESGDALGSLFASYAAEGAADKPSKKDAAPVHEELKSLLNAEWESNRDDAIQLRLAARVGNPAAIVHAGSVAERADAPEAVRVEQIATIGQFGGQDAVPLLLGLVAGNSSVKIREAALDALRRIPDARTSSALIALYPKLDEGMRTRARDALFSRAPWSVEFVQAIDRGDIPLEDIPLTQLRALAQHEDADLKALVEKHWGAVRAGTPEEKLAEMRRLNNELNAGAGDPRKGRESFKNNCAKCHTFFGEGSLVGPDLTQSNRMDREYLLVSLVDPSLTIRKEYLQYVVETRDGGLYNGLIAERGTGSVTLINANAERTSIPAGEIAEIRESDQSLMPEGLITPLPGDEIRDLFAYMQSPGPLAANE